VQHATQTVYPHLCANLLPRLWEVLLGCHPTLLFSLLSICEVCPNPLQRCSAALPPVTPSTISRLAVCYSAVGAVLYSPLLSLFLVLPHLMTLPIRISSCTAWQGVSQGTTLHTYPPEGRPLECAHAVQHLPAPLVANKSVKFCRNL
jgi:hypothetical protein